MMGAARAKSGDLGGAALKSTHIWLHPPTWRAFSVQTTAAQQLVDIFKQKLSLNFQL
jgi:hypothetical protein